MFMVYIYTIDSQLLTDQKENLKDAFLNINNRIIKRRHIIVSVKIAFQKSLTKS